MPPVIDPQVSPAAYPEFQRPRGVSQEIAMYLSRFGVKHYKCLGEIDIPLTPIHVLIGENDAGKTSLLEAMAAFHASFEDDLPRIFPLPWAGRELLYQGNLVELSGRWDYRPGEPLASPQLEYAFKVSFPPEGRQCVLAEEWMKTGDGRIDLPREKSVLTFLNLWKRGKRPLPGPASLNTTLEAVFGKVKRAHAYRFDPKVMAKPAAIKLGRKMRLDPDGFGLPTLLLDILGFDPECFLHLRNEFCSFFPQFKSVRVEFEQAFERNDDDPDVPNWGKAVGAAIYFETRSGGTIRSQQASDGAILFLAFLALAHLPDPPNLILLEEPENGIYPKRLAEVLTILKEVANRTEGPRFPQIIMTTHSPYVLNFFEPEEVTFLSREAGSPDGPVRARPLRDAPNIKERMGAEFYLGELWYNLSEEDLFDEP